MFAAESEVICVGLRQEQPVLIHSIDHTILTAAAAQTPIAEDGMVYGYVETLFLTPLHSVSCSVPALIVPTPSYPQTEKAITDSLMSPRLDYSKEKSTPPDPLETYKLRGRARHP